VATEALAGAATSFDGERGSFSIDPTDKTGADFRAKGRLQEVGQHYLQFAGNKEYFIKMGAGSPENFLAYADFDNTFAGRKPLHYYANHAKHYRAGDPTWKNGKGKSIVGAINYLASKGVNSLYFLTMNVNGDGDDVFPWTTKAERYRYDVSKLAQWEIVFSYMEESGLHLLVMTQERENDQMLDGGALGVQRKLYYRELIARFGHHLGVTWNLGEETSNTAAQRDAYASYINGIDPYFHLIAVHTYPSERTSIYTAMLGNPLISGASMQLESPSIVHGETLKWVSKSAATGSKWVVTVDELGGAGVGVVPDANDPTHADIVHRVLWGSLLAGGAGVEWYFGYNFPNDDLTCEDWTTRDRMWTLSQYATNFIRSYMPLPLVSNYDSLTSSTSDYCFGKPGVAYAIFLPDGTTTNITLPSSEAYTVQWFNPRTGGNLVTGSVASVAGGTVAIGRPPSELSSDWVALLRRTTTVPDSTTPPPSTVPTDPVAGTGLAVDALTLIDASTQRALRTLADGGTIDLNADGVALNIAATVSGTAGSVTFILDGITVRTENVAPYSVGADDGGIYRAWKPAIGSHTLKVIPFTGGNRTGEAGTAKEIHFSVVASVSGSTSPATPTTSTESVSASTVAVSSLTLINVVTQRDLRSLTDGATIDLSADGSGLNVRANVSGTVGSVVFMLDGAKFRTESVAPFALGLDDGGVYRAWRPALGGHVLKAIPYSGGNGSGTAGTPMEIHFSVVD
jgi:hypothetical protein